MKRKIAEQRDVLLYVLETMNRIDCVAGTMNLLRFNDMRNRVKEIVG